MSSTEITSRMLWLDLVLRNDRSLIIAAILSLIGGTVFWYSVHSISSLSAPPVRYEIRTKVETENCGDLGGLQLSSGRPNDTWVLSTYFYRQKAGPLPDRDCWITAIEFVSSLPLHDFVTANGPVELISVVGYPEDKPQDAYLRDDYMVKPFEPAELFARIRAALRRPLPDSSRVLKLGNLRLNCQSRNFRVSGETIVLPRREIVLLETLMRCAGRVVTREFLESAMYGYDDEIQSNTLESHVSRLRKHLAGLDAAVTVHTIRGVGYMLKEAE